VGKSLKFFGECAPGEIRTPDPVVRSHVLYPTELRAHCMDCCRLLAIGDPPAVTESRAF
jgi:hypothetical protein